MIQFIALCIAVVVLLAPAQVQAISLARYPQTVSRPPAATLKLDVPVHKQERRLSCEAATLRMILLYKGLDVSETELVDKTPVGPMGSDPDEVFVGSINGFQFSSGYGIHPKGLEKVADTYADAEAFQHQNLEFLIDRLHDNNPVVTWGSFVRNPGRVSWTTPEGKTVSTWRGEHTFVVVGYSGPRTAPTHVFTIDPLVGPKVFRTGDFLQNWALFNNSGLFLK